MKRLLILLLALVPVSTFAQGVRYDNIAIRSNGLAIAAPTVNVCTGITNPLTTCTTGNASLFSDVGLTVSQSNPTIGDNLGNYGFYIAPGNYTLTISASGISPVSFAITLSPNTTAALKPATSDAIQYVSVNGNDANDGRSWGSAKASLSSAISALPSTGLAGGTVMVASNYTASITSTLQIGNLTTTNVVIRPVGRMILECNITNGTPCIEVASSSGIDCSMTSINNCVIDIPAGSIVDSGIATLPGKTNELLILRNVDVRNWSGSQGGTVNTALWNLTGIFDTQMIGDSCTMGANTIGMEFHDDADGINAPNNVNITGLNCGPGGGASGTGLQDLLIKADHSVPIGPISISGADFGAHTNTTAPSVDLEATTAPLVDINIDKIYGEGNPSAAMTAPFFLNNGGDGVRIRDFQINRLFASASNFAVQIENTVGANMFAGEFSGTITGGSGNNFIEDSVNSVNLNDNGNGHYFFINGTKTNNLLHIGQSSFSNAGLAIGSGSVFTSSGAGGTMAATVASGTAAMTTTAIAAGACGSTVTVPGAGIATTDTIIYSFNASVAANPGELTLRFWPTSGNVNFEYCNPTAGSVTPNAATLNWKVVR